MKVVIDSVIRISDLPAEMLKQIQAELTMKNPEYIKKKAMGLNRYAWGPEFIKLWSEHDINGIKEYILPRGFFARLWTLAKLTPGLIEDNRVKWNPVKFPGKPNLRDYQKPAPERAAVWEQGVVLMPCGAGKTETALGTVAELGQPTLWITHTMDLLNQSMERAKSRLLLRGSQIGIIQGENMSIGTHITFATVQTLSKRDLSLIRDKFGCIVIDECHLVFKDAAKARMFESVISQFPARYRMGLTASEHRSDGLIDTMFHVIGPKIYEVTQEDLNEAGNVVVPKVEFIETDFEYAPEEDEMLNVQKMIAEMKYDTKRNAKIHDVLDTVDGTADTNDCCIVLGDSLEHLRDLMGYVEYHTPWKAAFVCGTTPKKEREKIMSDMKNGKYVFLFATYQLAKLGLDIPRLNKLVLATPKRDKTSIQQAVGRIMRPHEGKPQPVVYDIWDSKVPQLRYWARDRVRVYQSLGCEIIGGPKVRK